MQETRHDPVTGKIESGDWIDADPEKVPGDLWDFLLKALDTNNNQVRIVRSVLLQAEMCGALVCTGWKWFLKEPLYISQDILGPEFQHASIGLIANFSDNENVEGIFKMDEHDKFEQMIGDAPDAEEKEESGGGVLDPARKEQAEGPSGASDPS